MANLKKIVKKNKKLATGESLANNRFKTPIFRVSYPYLYKPSTYDKENPKYGLTMLFDTNLVDLSQMKKLVKSVAIEKFGKKLPKNLKLPFRDGEEKEDVDGYGEGIIFAAAYSQDVPGVCDAEFTACEDLKAGDYARATVNVFAFDNQRRGVALGLQNVQKIADGEPFGAIRPDAEDDFDDLNIDDEDLEDDDDETNIDGF